MGISSAPRGLCPAPAPCTGTKVPSTRTRALAFPGGHPQERVLNVAFFVNRYGPAVADRLIELLPRETDKHYVLRL